jgi:hypothetical protein
LEEVGKFESAHVAASGPDFPLEISEDRPQVFQAVALAEQFIPHPFPVKAQAHTLPGPLAIELVGLADRGGLNRKGMRTD